MSGSRKESIISETQSFTHLTYSKNKVCASAARAGGAGHEGAWAVRMVCGWWWHVQPPLDMTRSLRRHAACVLLLRSAGGERDPVAAAPARRGGGGVHRGALARRARAAGRAAQQRLHPRVELQGEPGPSASSGDKGDDAAECARIRGHTLTAVRASPAPCHAACLLRRTRFTQSACSRRRTRSSPSSTTLATQTSWPPAATTARRVAARYARSTHAARPPPRACTALSEHRVRLHVRVCPPLQVVIWDTTHEHERIGRSKASAARQADATAQAGSDEPSIPVIKCK